jgi:eukaryotic-like serine/threonine-protein kinase
MVGAPGGSSMQTIGRYQLVEKLGQGGMGVVYRAFDTLLQRVVAVKVISGTIEAGSEQRERFFREARAAGQLSHRNIITIHDLGEHEGQPYLAMEYLEGEDLQHRLTRPDRMSLSRKVELAIEVCEGLEFAHARGVVHRDIKPANIFITDNGTAKILDFGLARLVTSELTNSNVMMGTINYMAPEQVRGERADHRSDIFSFGVVFYELLGGRKAFEGDSFATTIYKILQETPVPLEQLDPGIPPPIVAIVERAIEKTREGRYQHTGEMLRDLTAYRQQLMITNSPAFGSMAQIAHDAPTIAAPAGSHPPFAPTTPRPSGTVPIATGPVSPASAPAADAEGSKRRLVLAAAVAIAAIGTLVIWSATRNDAPATMSASVGPSVPAQTEAKPDDGEAERVAQAVERGLESARGLLKAGQFEAAATAAGEVLALAPANADAKRIMDEAATRSRGRGAEEARKRMISARGAAVAASAQTLAAASYAEAQKAQREAESLMDRGQSSEAMAKFWEASGLFRSAEIAAHTEAAARRERARAQANAKPTAPPSRETSPAPSPATPPSTPATVPATTGLTLPPAAPVAPPVVPPAPPVQAQPQQQAQPPAPTREQPPPEAGVAELLDRYKAALEGRSIDALRRIWPGMSRSQEAAMRSDFKNANRIRVEILGPQISVRGNNATVTFVRRYQLDTVEGQQHSADTRTTLTAHRDGSGWVIDQIRFENAP